MTKNTGGGKATTAGTTFQENVAAWFAVLILAEADSEPPCSLPSNTTLIDLIAETLQPIDDLQVGTSADGVLLIQVKTTVSLSETNEVFLSIASQFSRQYFRNVGRSHNRRPLDLDRDRFVLAVSHAAPATVRLHLRRALDAIRSTNTQQITEDVVLSLNTDELKALECLKSTLRNTSLQSKRTMEDDDLACLLRMVHVLEFDFDPDGSTLREAHNLLRSSVLQDPSQASAAWNTLIATCREFSPKRTGGDRTYLREELSKSQIHIKAPRSYNDSIDKLKAYTDQRMSFLRDLSIIHYGEQELKIKRAAVDDLLSFAGDGHALVIGAPGSGKSGCLHDFVDQALDANSTVVLVAADQLDASSAQSLAVELGLTQQTDLVDVLVSWKEPGASYLVVDALDAARSEYGLRSFLDVLQRIHDIAPHWTTVVSIREFDLKHSRDLQRLFSGKPHTNRVHKDYPNVRHLLVSEFDDNELAEIKSQNPDLAEAIATAHPSFQEHVIRNPFNLRLLCEILGDSSSEQFTAVKTQLDLLDLYWERRIGSDAHEGSANHLLGLITTAMVTKRTLAIRQSEFDLPSADSSRELKRLLSNRALIEYPGRLAGAPPSYSFAHNILYDYAIARLWVQDYPKMVIQELSSPGNHDLLIAIRPSMTMALRRLWHQYGETDRRTFWNRGLEVQSSTGVRLVGKIIAGNVAADEYATVSDITSLIDAIKDADTRNAAISLLKHFISAAVACHRDNPLSYPLIGPDAKDWIGLAEVLLDIKLDEVTLVVLHLLDRSSLTEVDLTAAQLKVAGIVARRLMTWATEHPDNVPAALAATSMVCATVDSDPPQSIASLKTALAPDLINQWGHRTLDIIAKHMPAVAVADVDFTATLICAIFHMTADGNETETLGGRILPLTFRKSDMLSITQLHVAEQIGIILKTDPRIGTRLLLIAVNAFVEAEHPAVLENIEPDGFTFLGGTANLISDRSHIWAAGSHNHHQPWFKMLEAFRQTLSDVINRSDTDLLRDLLTIVRDDNILAIIWNSVLIAARPNARVAAPLIHELIGAPPILISSDTRFEAGNLIRDAYQYLDDCDRKRIENAIASIVENGEEGESQYKSRIRDQLYGCIPESLIATSIARVRRAALNSVNGPPVHAPDFEIGPMRSPSHRESLEDDGVDLGNQWNVKADNLIQQITAFPDLGSQQPPTIKVTGEILPKLTELKQLGESATTYAIHPTLANPIDSYLIDCCKRIAGAPDRNRDAAWFPIVKQILLSGSEHPKPEYTTSMDASWDEGLAGWGSPSPRIDAAQGLMRIASKPDTVSNDVLEAIERLANDRCPSVRHQISVHLLMLQTVAPTMMWKLIGQVSEHEDRLVVLNHFAHSVMLKLIATNWGRVDQHFQCLYERVRQRTHADDVRKAYATYCLRRSLWDESRAHQSQLNDWINDPVEHSPEVGRLIDLCRSLLEATNESQSPADRDRGRQYAITLMRTIVSRIRQLHAGLRDAQPSHPSDWQKDALEHDRALRFHTHAIVTQLLFGSGADQDSDMGTLDHNERGQFLEGQNILFNMLKPLLEELAHIPYVEAAYDLLQILQHFMPVQPTDSFTIAATLLATSKSDYVQFESMAADIVVQIVEQFLTEHRDLIRTNQALQQALLDVLDQFVEAGWPRATALTYRLDEVFR